MKTHAIEWNDPVNERRKNSLNPVGKLDSATRVVSRGILALLPALVMVIGAAWLVTQQNLVIYLQAALWASGFVFFGLALDLKKAAIGLSLATGFALPLLAWLSSNVAVEFSIIAVVLVAAWVATAIWCNALQSQTTSE